MKSQIISAETFLKTHKIVLPAIAFSLSLYLSALILICNFVIGTNSRYVIASSNPVQSDVGLVLGAGITKDGKPFKELQARLDSAAEAINNGTVKKLILSGDNRFAHYDEPTAMYNYLAEVHGIDKDKLVRDYAGRSTYESCERAAKIFQVKKIILFSANSHLPRAIYLCRQFDVEAYGIGNNVEANNSGRRELMARVKAIYNAKILGERTILGEPIQVD